MADGLTEVLLSSRIMIVPPGLMLGSHNEVSAKALEGSLFSTSRNQEEYVIFQIFHVDRRTISLDAPYWFLSFFTEK